MSRDTSNHKSSRHRSRFVIEERRRQVAKLRALGESEAEIADELGVSQRTISSDIMALGEMSRQFVFDLANWSEM
jgi:DNA-binding NarL/FixJ family response regulator